ncbi:MAG: EAL domain-containing protein [Pseudomonadota bacterium]
MGQRWARDGTQVTYHAGFERKVLWAFLAAMAVVTILIGINWMASRNATQAVRSVAHSQEVLHHLAHAHTYTLQVELSTQAYRLTGDDSQLVERDQAMAARETALAEIRQLTRENAYQQSRWVQLRQVIDQRIAISQTIEKLRKTQGPEAATAYTTTAPLQATRQLSRRLLAEMEAEEDRLLRERQQQEARSSRHNTIAASLVALSLFALLAATYLLIRRQARTNEASHRALLESEENLSTILHSIGDAVLVTDAAECVLSMNPVAEQLTGWTIAEARGLPVDIVFDIVHEQTHEPALVPVAEVLRTGSTQALADHTLLRSRGGDETAIADSAAPIHDALGAVAGVVLVFRDVTDERRAQKIIRGQNEMLADRVREQTARLRESQEHLLGVIGNVPAMIAYVDATQRYVYVNEQYRARFAPEQPDITGCTVADILGPERYARLCPLVDKVLAGAAQEYDWQPFPRIWHVVNYIPRFDGADRVLGYYILSSDITERKRTQEHIVGLNRELEKRVGELERVSRALRTLSAGNGAMLRATDEAQLLDHMCRAMVHSGGYPLASVWYREDDAVATLRPMAESGYADGLDGLARLDVRWADNERGQGAIATAARTGETCIVGDLHENPGYRLWRQALWAYRSCIACPLRIDGKVIGALAIFSHDTKAFGADDSQLLCASAEDLAFGIATLRTRARQQQAQDEIYRLTRYDPLTGLPNETFFTESLAQAVDAAGPDGPPPARPFALLQVNIERLREINDALGFSQGDRIIRDFGLRLRQALAPSAILARLRGDEFGVLLPGATVSDAAEAVHRIGRALAEPFPISDIFLHLSAKAGLVAFPEHGSTVHDLMRHMDIALNQAKAGRLAFQVFDTGRNRDHRGRLEMAGELRHAIADGDLRLYVQPKVEIATGRVCGVEGLVRWLHAGRGLVLPAEFLPLAERTGLIRPLTLWVMETAMQLGNTWQAAGCGVPIAVNISASDLRDNGLAEEVHRMRARWKPPAGSFEIELTESTVMEDAEFALLMLQRLRDEGIVLYIDDFGTGYSSLSYLQKLPVQYIKIDQSFVRDMGRNIDSAVIVRSTIDLAHDLGRRVVAEGIETQDDFTRLAELGCDIAQGYFIARPMPAEDFPAWFQAYGRRGFS